MTRSIKLSAIRTTACTLYNVFVDASDLAVFRAQYVDCMTIHYREFNNKFNQEFTKPRPNEYQEN